MHTLAAEGIQKRYLPAEKLTVKVNTEAPLIAESMEHRVLEGYFPFVSMCSGLSNLAHKPSLLGDDEFMYTNDIKPTQAVDSVAIQSSIGLIFAND